MSGLKAFFGTKSIWAWEHWKPSGRSGAYALNDAWEESNITTDEGVTHALDVVFSGGAKKSAWYMSLFNDDYTPLGSDTYQSPGYTESSNYSQGARPTWQEAGVASKSITNAANVASFTMTASETIYGGSLLSASTKGDSASGEVMYCSSQFTTSRDVEIDDILKVTATISGQDV